MPFGIGIEAWATEEPQALVHTSGGFFRPVCIDGEATGSLGIAPSADILAIGITPYAVGKGDNSLLITGEQRHHADQLMLGLFYRERSYAVPLTAWNASTAISLPGFADSAAHEVYNDTIVDDDALVHHAEYPTRQRIVRQSVQIPYSEPRCSARTFAAFLSLALGAVVSVEDGLAWAFRHTITQASGMALPSVSAQIRHMFSAQLRYAGLKAESITVRSNGDFVALDCPLLGSGQRGFDAEPFVALREDAWLMWNDSHLYLKDVSAAPLTVPSVPTQDLSNLGAGVIDISRRVLRMEVGNPNQLLSDRGYRPASGITRGTLDTTKRRTDLLLELEVDPATERAQLTWYFEQTPLAFEWQCISNVLIDPAGTFRYGVALCIPKLQLRAIPRGEQANFDTLSLTGRILDDKVNPVLIGWAWTQDEGYLR